MRPPTHSLAFPGFLFSYLSDRSHVIHLPTGQQSDKGFTRKYGMGSSVELLLADINLNEPDDHKDGMEEIPTLGHLGIHARLCTGSRSWTLGADVQGVTPQTGRKSGDI